MLIPLIRDQVSQIRALGFPTADADMLAAVFDDLDAILDRAEADPSVMMMDSTALFADVNARLAAYGLDVCSQIVG
jgi:hypothetical protein